MKYRYVIERAFGDEGYVVSEATPSDPSYRLGRSEYATVNEAKAAAEQGAPEPLTWKPAPKAWGPDAITVSQYVNDGVEENRDP